MGPVLGSLWPAAAAASQPAEGRRPGEPAAARAAGGRLAPCERHSRPQLPWGPRSLGYPQESRDNSRQSPWSLTGVTTPLRRWSTAGGRAGSVCSSRRRRPLGAALGCGCGFFRGGGGLGAALAAFLGGGALGCGCGGFRSGGGWGGGLAVRLGGGGPGCSCGFFRGGGGLGGGLAARLGGGGLSRRADLFGGGDTLGLGRSGGGWADPIARRGAACGISCHCTGRHRQLGLTVLCAPRRGLLDVMSLHGAPQLSCSALNLATPHMSFH